MRAYLLILALLFSASGYSQQLWTGGSVKYLLGSKAFMKVDFQNRARLYPLGTVTSFVDGNAGYRLLKNLEFRGAYRYRFVRQEGEAITRYAGAFVFKPKFQTDITFASRAMYQMNTGAVRGDFKDAFRFLAELGYSIKSARPYFYMESFHRVPELKSLSRLRTCMGLEVKTFERIEINVFYMREDVFNKEILHDETRYITGVTAGYTINPRKKVKVPDTPQQD